MKARLLRDLKTPPAPGQTAEGDLPLGMIYEHPDVYLLVQLGVAEPADDECSKAAGMTQEMMMRAQHAQERTSRGIVPDDFELYDQGKILGYNPDGSYIRGPNWDTEPEEEEEESQLWIPEDFDK